MKINVKKKFEILDDIESGKYSIRQLANKHKCSPETILRIKKQGWEYSPHGRKKAPRYAQMVREMYERGLSVRNILFRLRKNNISESTVRNILFRPDMELEEHIRYYVAYGKWDMVEKYIKELYVIKDKTLLTKIPVEMLNDFQIIQKVEYEMSNVDIEIRELVSQLKEVKERNKTERNRNFYRAIALIIYLLPQISCKKKKDLMKEASDMFEKYESGLEKYSENYYSLALSTYCIHLLKNHSSQFMKYTNRLIKRFHTIRSPTIRHLLMTRLRLLGFPQYADEEDPSQVISLLFKGNLEKIEEIYNRFRYTDIVSIRNRLNYAMFYAKLLKGRIKEAEIFLKKFAEADDKNGLAEIAINIAKAHFLMVSGRRDEALEMLKNMSSISVELGILFGKKVKAITPRLRITKYYAEGKLKEAYRLSRKYNLMGLLIIDVLSRPKYLSRLKRFPELKFLYELLSSDDPRVKIYLLQRKPRMVHIKDTIYLTRTQTLFLLKFLDKNDIRVDNSCLRRINRVIRMLKRSCVIVREPINGKTRFLMKERNIYYDIEELEEHYNRALNLEKQNRMEEASLEKKRARKLVQAIPFFQQAYKDIEVSYILDRILNQIKYVSA